MQKLNLLRNVTQALRYAIRRSLIHCLVSGVNTFLRKVYNKASFELLQR